MPLVTLFDCLAYICIMAEKEKRGVSIQVDKLTHSIEDAKTGERFETSVTQLLPAHLGEIKKSHWLFDWKEEVLVPGREVYKLWVDGKPKVIQGLVSLEDVGNPIHLHLIESAKFNRGNARAHFGVAGNLFAFACRMSLEMGYEGFVSFDSKTRLIDHYVKNIGASRLHGNRLYIDQEVAKRLISLYFSG